MLRGIVGTDLFWVSLQRFYEEHQNRGASTEDFRRTMEQTSGKDLKPFFSQWLRRAGTPTLAMSWSYDQATRRVRVDLSQSSAGEPYRLPLEIGWGDAIGAGPRLEKIELTRHRQSFEFASGSKPASVSLDPRHWVLFKQLP